MDLLRSCARRLHGRGAELADTAKREPCDHHHSVPARLIAQSALFHPWQEPRARLSHYALVRVRAYPRCEMRPTPLTDLRTDGLPL